MLLTGALSVFLAHQFERTRLAVLERIVTDQPLRLAKEIDQLALDKGGHA